MVIYRQTQKAKANSSLAVLLAGNFVTILDLFIVNIALPDIQRELQATNAELQMIIVAYSVSYGAMLLNGARLGDFFGRRRLFLSGMAIFALASFLCGLASLPWILIAARALQGFGAALLMPQVYSSIRLLFDDEERRRAFAIMGAVQGIAGAASQILGGCLIALNLGTLGWRLIFFVNLPIAAYALIAGPWFIIETKEAAPAKLDLLGALLGTAALTTLLMPAMTGQEQQWPLWVIVGLSSSLPLFGTFFAYESHLRRRGGDPIIDLSLFRNGRFVLGMLASFLFFSAISSFSLSLTIFLQIGLAQTPLHAALVFLPSTVAFFVGSLASTRFTNDQPQALPYGMILFGLGLLIAIAGGLAGEATWAMSLSVILQGFGQGIVIPLLLNMILSTVADMEAGMVSGIFSTIQTVGGAFGVTIVGLIMFSVIRKCDAEVTSNAEAYGTAFAVATIYNLTAVALGFALFRILHRRNRACA